jgi:uncharacterized DUF497 family protein
MKFEWNDEKRASNIQKHGVDFLRAALIFEGPILEWIDNREEYGEERLIALGLAQGTVYRITYTLRQERVRIISARKASKHEQEIYYRSIYAG